MLQALLNKQPESEFSILCLGAHSDDIEIGCGGTLLRLSREYQHLNVTWVVLGAKDLRAQEAHTSADAFLAGASEKNVIVKDFQDGYFPYVGAQIKDYFEQLKRQVSPDLIFTHYRQDLHQDHRCVSELTWNTFRNHLILEYEIPKYDGDLGHPNFFVQLDQPTCTRKIEHLLANFNSQTSRGWFTADLFYSILRIRGVESNAKQQYAEAFYCRKLLF